jgi:hypothetical protein
LTYYNRICIICVLKKYPVRISGKIEQFFSSWWITVTFWNSTSTHFDINFHIVTTGDFVAVINDLSWFCFNDFLSVVERSRSFPVWGSMHFYVVCWLLGPILMTSMRTSMNPRIRISTFSRKSAVIQASSFCARNFLMCAMF